jgi:hypothetical protein
MRAIKKAINNLLTIPEIEGQKTEDEKTLIS